MINQKKKELRKEYKQKRRALTEEQVKEGSARIQEQFLHSDIYKSEDNLLIYVSQDNEVDTVPVIKQALSDGKTVAVPKVYGDHMHFHRIHGLQDLKAGAYGILEPENCEMIHPSEGILIVPGIVFDEKGHRIGYGGGYYDRYIKKHPELTTVAFAYDFQVIPEIDCEAFDEKPQMILTPSGIWSF